MAEPAALEKYALDKFRTFALCAANQARPIIFYNTPHADLSDMAVAIMKKLVNLMKNVMTCMESVEDRTQERIG